MIFFLINLFQDCLERLLCLVAQLSNDKPLVTYTTGKQPPYRPSLYDRYKRQYVSIVARVGAPSK